MVYSYVKQPFDVQSHLDEYRDYQSGLPRYLKDEEVIGFLQGFTESIGFWSGPEEEKKKTLRPVWDYKLGVAFFPWLDEYWTRAGRIWITKKDVSQTRLMPLRLRIASCLREARNRDELHRLIDYSRKPNNKDWFWLGGSE